MGDDLGHSLNGRGDDLLKGVLKAAGAPDCFSTPDRKLSISESARRTDLPRGGVHRVMTTLRDIGFGGLPADTFFVGKQAAGTGLAAVNHSRAEPVVMLKRVGPNAGDRVQLLRI